MAVKYIGTEPGRVRIGTRPILPGDTIAGPPEVVEELRRRSDFVEEPGQESSEENDTDGGQKVRE